MAMCSSTESYRAQKIHPLLLEILKQRKWPLKTIDPTEIKVFLFNLFY
jgi:hypothetical protein